MTERRTTHHDVDKLAIACWYQGVTFKHITIKETEFLADKWLTAMRTPDSRFLITDFGAVGLTVIDDLPNTKDSGNTN